MADQGATVTLKLTKPEALALLIAERVEGRRPAPGKRGPYKKRLARA